MYYPRYGIVFIGINKTGSSSALTELNKVFYDPDVPEIWQCAPGSFVLKKDRYLKHAQAYFYQQYLGAEVYVKSFSFSFVRNPWDKMVSTFFFRCSSPAGLENWRKARHWYIDRGLDGPTDNPPIKLFKPFLIAIKNRQIPPHGHWHLISKTFKLADIRKENINQFDGLTDLNGELIVDKIIKTEDIKEGWKDLQSELFEKTGKKPGDIPHINKTNRKHYREYYDDESRAMVEEMFSKDIVYFGYRF